MMTVRATVSRLDANERFWSIFQQLLGGSLILICFATEVYLAVNFRYFRDRGLFILVATALILVLTWARTQRCVDALEGIAARHSAESDTVSESSEVLSAMVGVVHVLYFLVAALLMACVVIFRHKGSL
jgi:hypothetical protein